MIIVRFSFLKKKSLFGQNKFSNAKKQDIKQKAEKYQTAAIEKIKRKTVERGKCWLGVDDVGVKRTVIQFSLLRFA